MSVSSFFVSKEKRRKWSFFFFFGKWVSFKQRTEMKVVRVSLYFFFQNIADSRLEALGVETNAVYFFFRAWGAISVFFIFSFPKR